MKQLLSGVALVMALSSTAAAGNTNFTGDDWTSRFQYDWKCWDLTIPSGAQTLEMNTSGGTGDVDLRVYNNYGATWDTASPFCSKTSLTNTEDCSVELQNRFNAGQRNFTICVKGYALTNNVAINGGYVTPTGTTNTAGSGTVNYYLGYYRDLLFWPAYHREFCLFSYNGTTGNIESDQDYDGFSDQDYCKKGEHYSSGPAAREGAYMNSIYMGTNWTTVKAKADNCGQWTNRMHGHTTTNHTQYLKRPPAVSYNLLTDNNSDCWAQDFSQCMGITMSDGIVAPLCVDEAHPAY